MKGVEFFMKIDTEKDQSFLFLLYSLQKNKSNAASEPRTVIKRFEEREVIRTTNQSNGLYWYSLAPLPEPERNPENINSELPEHSKGGRPRKLTAEQEPTIRKWKSMDLSNVEIAHRLGVSEGTIRNFCKLMSIL